MYHRAGMMSETYRNISGILSMGKTIPDNKMMGSSNPIADMSSATNCVEAMELMSNPNDKASII